MKDLPKIESSDTFPLWSFGYMHPPKNDNRSKIRTSRGRTWQEAWMCVQHINKSFGEPSKVGLLGTVAIEHKKAYGELHQYDWFHDAPLWLKQTTGQSELIW